MELVDSVIESERYYFQEIDILKSKQGYPDLKKKILSDYGITMPQEAYPDLEKLFISYIEESISLFIDSSCVDGNILLADISKQVQIDYLLGNLSKEKVTMYYSLSTTQMSYGIHRNGKIQPLSNSIFWTGLIKKLYLLNFMSINGFNDSFEQLYTVDKSIPELVASIRFFNNVQGIKINCIDGKVLFNKHQENSIVKIIEKKLHQLDIFKFIEYLLKDKKDKSLPYNYIFNILIKNIHKSNHKKKDETTFLKLSAWFRNFLNLYQLQKISQFETMFIDAKNIEKLLKKQVLYANLYQLSYPLKTLTVKTYIDKLLDSKFEKDFFSKKNYDDFLQLLDSLAHQNVIKIDKNIFQEFKNILTLLSVDAKIVNQDYELPRDVGSAKNIFPLNPIILYKNEYYIIGFQYFKMYFYSALVEKIRLNINSSVSRMVGNHIDNYVEEVFKKQKVRIFKGKYKATKNDTYECDLVVKTETEIIFIENKNKFLTKNAFAGSSIHILQDLIRSFATSQHQLLRHEKYIRDNKKIIFSDGQELEFNEERIVKISLSPNNWYGIMNNIPKSLIYSLMGLRFSFKENTPNEIQKDFEETNKDLIKLTKTVESIHERYDLKQILHNSLFVPLELICENHLDSCFIPFLLGLISTKDNADNIYDSYNNYRYIRQHRCGK